jgi:hypothetical protein
MRDAQPASGFGEGAIEIDPNPGLAVFRASFGETFLRHMLVWGLREVDVLRGCGGEP